MSRRIDPAKVRAWRAANAQATHEHRSAFASLPGSVLRELDTIGTAIDGARAAGQYARVLEHTAAYNDLLARVQPTGVARVDDWAEHVTS